MTIGNISRKSGHIYELLQQLTKNVKIDSYLCTDTSDLDLIETKPGYTEDDKPFDWMVREKLESGTWHLECIRPDILGLKRPLEVYRAIRKTNLIKPWITKGADEGYCPAYWADIAIGQGACGMRCRFCFLLLTLRCRCDPSRHVLYENIEDYVNAVIRFLRSPLRNNLGLGIDCSDSLLYEGVTGHARRLIPLFVDTKINQHGCKLILLTKSTNVHYLKGCPTENVVLSFSLNPEPVADLWEGKWNDGLRITPSIEKRLNASLEAERMGFEVRWRVDPILPVEHWQDYYLEFFEYAATHDHRPIRITLGTYREMGVSLTTFSEKWGLPPLEWQPPDMEKDGSHYHIPVDQRISIYLFLKAAIEDTWRGGGHQPIVALCKETNIVRKATGITHNHCNCE